VDGGVEYAEALGGDATLCVVHAAAMYGVPVELEICPMLVQSEADGSALYCTHLKASVAGSPLGSGVLGPLGEDECSERFGAFVLDRSGEAMAEPASLDGGEEPSPETGAGTD
jgi:hypothetical protein